MDRRIVANIYVNEREMFRFMETNGIDDDGDISFIADTINKILDGTGVCIGECRILDEDDSADIKAINMINTVLNCEECNEHEDINLDYDIALEWEELISHSNDTIVVDKDIFDVFEKDCYINILFIDIEDNSVHTYIMEEETEEGIKMRLLSNCN